MTNNEIIQRLRYLLDVDDEVIKQCFTLGGATQSEQQFSALMARTDAAEFAACSDQQMVSFLDGLIILRRGPSDNKSSGASSALDNNIMLKKIRIALELQAQDLDNIFMLTDAELSAHEISALFRKPGNKHFSECSDELLAHFLGGLSLYWRTEQ